MGSNPGSIKPQRLLFCFFFTKHAALRSESKDYLALIQGNVYEWSDMSIRERCFTTPLVIEVHISNQENEVVVMYLCVRGINLASF